MPSHKHIQENQVIRPSRHGSMKGRSCLINLLSSYDKVTCLVAERKAVDVVYLDFSKAFHTISYSILLEQLAAHGLDRGTLHWVKNLTGLLGPKSGGGWSQIQLVAGHKGCSSGLSTGLSCV